MAGVLSTDSRWSKTAGDWIAYVEDTDYDKLAYTHRVAFLFAGDLPQIDRWKHWITSGMKKADRPAQIPNTKLSVIQVDVATKKIIFQSHNFLSSRFGVLVRALFAGTGAKPAQECWDVSKCATKAIESASKKDDLSGGKVVYFNCNTRVSNVTNTATAQAVEDQFKDRGILMHTANAYMPILVKDAAKDPSNNSAYAVATSIMSAASPLTAPFPGMDEPWSLEKMAEFDAALSLYEED